MKFYTVTKTLTGTAEHSWFLYECNVTKTDKDSVVATFGEMKKFLHSL